MNKNGFSLIEIVFTIIIIGLAMGAITESFIAGSAKSVNIVNEETAALNYCRNGGTVGTPPNYGMQRVSKWRWVGVFAVDNQFHKSY